MRIYYCKELYNEWTDEPVPNWPRDYDLVAEIDQCGLVGHEALEKAFSKTQNHGGDWTRNEGVKAFQPECRSLYPGDVVALDDGELYRCEASGWSHIATLWAAKVRRGQQMYSSPDTPQAGH
jgi:hypothetical protein